MLFGDGQTGLEVQLVGLQLLETVAGRGGKNALLDGGHDVFQRPLRVGQLLGQQGDFRVCGGLELVGVGGIGDGPDGIGSQHFGPDCGGDVVLDVSLADIFQGAVRDCLVQAALACVVMAQIAVSGSAGDSDQGTLAASAKQLTG